MLKTMIKSTVRRFGYDLVPVKERRALPPDMDSLAADTIRWVNPFDKQYTQTSVECVFSLIEAVRYVTAAAIPGAIVECGVWRGGSMMAVARTLQQLGVTDRELVLFDTFEGMTAPTQVDITYDGRAADKKFAETRRGDTGSSWCFASLEDVTRNMGSSGYPKSRVKFVKGRVEDTVPSMAPEQIALLRLDTDWYESTLHEMEHLYPRRSKGGVLIVDDYGHWRGHRKAIDEYFQFNKQHPLLNRIDYAGRLLCKP